MKKKIIITAVLLPLVIFLIVSVVLNLSYIEKMDTMVFNLILKSRNGFFSFFLTVISLFGEVITIVILAVLCFFIPKHKKIVVPILICLITSTLLNTVLKELIQRERPVGVFLENAPFGYHFPTSYSFPSGHSQNGILFYFLIFYGFFEKYKGNYKNKKIVYIGFFVFLLLMPISRVYLGVHFFSDVLTGTSLAILFIIWFTYYFDKYQVKLFEKERK